MMAEQITWAWAHETSRLLCLWGDAEQLCVNICTKLDWTNSGKRRQELLRVLERARQRSNRRYQAMRDYERSR